MISEATLARAVALGILSAEQADRVAALAREQVGAEPSEPQDEEKLRFISGFGDIFVTLGLVLFIGSAAYFLGRAFGAGATAALIAVIAWALAEFFTRKRRMALPSIVLLLVFAASSLAAISHILGLDGGTGFRGLGLFYPGGSGQVQPLALTGAALLTAALVALHYWRFRVPITVAAFAAAIGLALVALGIAFVPGFLIAHPAIVALVLGLLIFAAAMGFDLSDKTRATRRTDIAFWLHLLAAPLIVHPIVLGVSAGQRVMDAQTALSVLAVFVGLAVIALIVDRRAILVSGLVYAGFAFGSLIKNTGLGNQAVPATLLALGAFVLLLSAGWRPLRGTLLRFLPAGLAARLPHPLASP